MGTSPGSPSSANETHMSAYWRVLKSLSFLARAPMKSLTQKLVSAPALSNVYRMFPFWRSVSRMRHPLSIFSG